ncbi:MAG TPA: GNAT family N-acetyltransferase [Myxococcales bacterium]|nr:GNAT family N-acetyltransferase [Myxococcales bacterium]
MYFLRTDRLGFRRWRDEDLSLAIGLWGDSEVTRFIDARGPLSVEAVQRMLDEQIAMQREHAIQYWPIFLLDSGEHVGCCGLRPHDLERRIPELGVHVRRVFWRRGFAEEAAAAVIRHAFDRLGAAALFAGHNPKNDASRDLLKKLGFRYSHDEYYAPTGLRHPSYVLERS